jgi:uncharacterized phage protein gp47/JayE
MAVIDDTGITPTTLEEYITLLENAFKSAFGADFNTDPETPQGQFIGNVALSFSQSDDAHVVSAQALDIYKAFANQLEGLASLLGILKRAATKTTVTGNCTGVPATLIPAGSRAKSVNGDLYETIEDLTLDGAGTGSVTFRAIASGALVVGIGELTQIIDTVPGWETVNNTVAGSPGQDAEIDSEYRARYFTELFRNALTVREAIEAEVSQVENVVDQLVAENDTDAALIVDGVSLIAHSIAVVVDGGADQEIADAIRLRKTGGTAMNGTTTVPDPPNTDIKFYRVTEIPAEVDVDISIGLNFPGDGIQLMKQRILNYVNGAFAGAIDENYFETDGMKISEDLYRDRLYTPVNSVPGHTTNSLTINVKTPPGPSVAVIGADLNEKVVIESINDINISVT